MKKLGIVEIRNKINRFFKKTRYLVTADIGTLKTFDSAALVRVLLIPCCDCEYEIVSVTAPCLSKTTVNV